VVHDGRTGARPAGTLRRGDVGCDLLDTLRHVRRTRPRHGPHRQSTSNQLPNNRRAGPTRRSQDHMKRRSRRHRRSLRSYHHRRVHGVTPALSRIRQPRRPTAPRPQRDGSWTTNGQLGEDR
jgi:hypothetical protein